MRLDRGVKRTLDMGNVNVSSGRSTSDLSQFQINKLTFDFNTFFDLNNDGYLSYKVWIVFFPRHFVDY